MKGHTLLEQQYSDRTRRYAGILALTSRMIAKWSRRNTVGDRNAGLMEPNATFLSKDKTQLIVAFRQQE